MCPEEQTKLVGELEGTSCEEQLRTLGRCGLEKGRLRGDPTALCSFLSRARALGAAELSSLVSRDRT